MTNLNFKNIFLVLLGALLFFAFVWHKQTGMLIDAVINALFGIETGARGLEIRFWALVAAAPFAGAFVLLLLCLAVPGIVFFYGLWEGIKAIFFRKQKNNESLQEGQSEDVDDEPYSQYWFDDGYAEGYADGEQDGHAKGWNAGYGKGYQAAKEEMKGGHHEKK